MVSDDNDAHMASDQTKSSSGMSPYTVFRQEIDRMDVEILSLLNQRALMALRIGELKRQRNEPIHVPEREDAILSGLRGANPGPLSGTAVTRIFQTIIEQVRGLEQEQHEEK